MLDLHWTGLGVAVLAIGLSAWAGNRAVMAKH
jgi:hypothetical protein